jgi:hypothetical protein
VHPETENRLGRRLKLLKVRTAHGLATGAPTTMDFLFDPPDPLTGAAGELMSSVPKHLNGAQLISGAAANADQLGEGRSHEAKGLEGTGGGWDAYEVWRRFIKDARDRRKHSESN